MAHSRAWLKWMLVPIGLLVISIAAALLSQIVTREPLHANPQAIPSVAGKTPSPQWAPAAGRTRQMLQAAMAAQKLPGLSVAVGAGGAIVWAEGFGLADIRTHAPVTPDTRFRIGTASTVLTSAAVGLLLEKQRLKLDDRIQTYVPQFPNKQWPVTLRQLMADVSGIGTDRGDEDPLIRQRCEKPVEALPHFAQGALLFEPGTQYRHSNYGWVLVSAAVEAAAKQPFLTFLTEEIFRPLGMNNTGAESAKQENPERVGEPEEDPPPFVFIRQVILEPLGVVDPPARPATDPATIYSPGWGYGAIPRLGLHRMRLMNLSCYAGSMAFFSTPSDLVRFGLAVSGGALLQPATRQMLQAPQKLAFGQDTGHGLGWDLDTQGAGSEGKLLDRPVASWLTFRETGITVALMSNFSHADTHALARKIAEAFAQTKR